MPTIQTPQVSCNDKFDVIAGSFLQEKGLPFSAVLDANFIRQIFQDENAGRKGGRKGDILLFRGLPGASAPDAVKTPVPGVLRFCLAMVPSRTDARD